MTSTAVRAVLHAPRARVWAALVDPDAVAAWRFPEGMACTVHAFDAREGGELHVTLTYLDGEGAGKSSAQADSYRGRFVRLVPEELLVEADEFETDDPAFSGEMVMTIRLSDADDGGTVLEALHEGVPDAVSAEDNETGWREALARLAALVEDRG